MLFLAALEFLQLGKGKTEHNRQGGDEDHECDCFLHTYIIGRLGDIL